MFMELVNILTIYFEWIHLMKLYHKVTYLLIKVVVMFFIFHFVFYTTFSADNKMLPAYNFGKTLIRTVLIFYQLKEA